MSLERLFPILETVHLTQSWIARLTIAELHVRISKSPFDQPNKLPAYLESLFLYCLPKTIESGYLLCHDMRVTQTECFWSSSQTCMFSTRNPSRMAQILSGGSSFPSCPMSSWTALRMAWHMADWRIPDRPLLRNVMLSQPIAGHRARREL